MRYRQGLKCDGHTYDSITELHSYPNPPWTDAQKNQHCIDQCPTDSVQKGGTACNCFYRCGHFDDTWPNGRVGFNTRDPVTSTEDATRQNYRCIPLDNAGIQIGNLGGVWSTTEYVPSEGIVGHGDETWPKRRLQAVDDDDNRPYSRFPGDARDSRPLPSVQQIFVRDFDGDSKMDLFLHAPALSPGSCAQRCHSLGRFGARQPHLYTLLGP